METLTIERDKVEAAAKVSDTAAKVLKTLFPSDFPPVRKVGQVYSFDGKSDYLIARIDHDFTQIICVTSPMDYVNFTMPIGGNGEIDECDFHIKWKEATLVANSFEEYLKIRGAK